MKFFFNHCFDKRRFNKFINWFFQNQNCPHLETIVFLEKLKNLGFISATQAGVSISIEDLKIPTLKSNLLLTAEQSSMNQYLTPIETSQAILEIWNRTSEKLKYQVVQSFQISDLFNPVYMMAFSGARGNISQIRQLVAMRGLMADPLGQIIDFPIRSNFREGLTLTEYLICCSGARKGIVDTALRTASSGYLTRRLVDVAHHVVISQIDCETSKSIILEDLYDDNKKILSLQQRLVGRILAQTLIDDHLGVIGSKNQEITHSLSHQLCQFHQTIFLRSPLTCESPQFLCQLCYGWNLAEGQLVSIGEAVGILAAQSIGEPGTQLTMRTFHTGGVFTGILIDQTYAPFSGHAHYPSNCAGVLIRTTRGQIAFLSKNTTCLEIHHKANNQFQLFVPPLTLLYTPQGAFVHKNQLLATSGDHRFLSFVENEQQIFCFCSGQLYFENLILVEKTLQNLGEFWILFGQTAHFKQVSFHKFDLINNHVAFKQIQIHSIAKAITSSLQSFSIDFVFFKKIAYYNSTLKSIQTWMAGLRLQSKYDYKFNHIYVHHYNPLVNNQWTTTLAPKQVHWNLPLIIWNWQTGASIRKFYFLIVFFKQFIHSRKHHRCFEILNNRLGSCCFLKIQFLPLGFCINSQPALKRWPWFFETFFINSIVYDFPEGYWPSRHRWRGIMMFDGFYKTSDVTEISKHSFFNNVKQIKQITIDLYFNSFFNILSKFVCLQNNHTRFFNPSPKKIILQNFEIFFWTKPYFAHWAVKKMDNDNLCYRIFPLIHDNKKFNVYLNGICAINCSAAAAQSILYNQNLKLMISQSEIIRDDYHPRLIQRKIFANPIAQIFVRFYVPIKIGEVVTFESQKIIFNSFEHIFCYKITNLQNSPVLGKVYPSGLLNNKLFTKSGQLISRTENHILFRGAYMYLINNQSILHGTNGQIVNQNDHICTVFSNKSKTEDIIQGIPQIEHIFEARKKSKYSFHEIVMCSKNLFDFEKTILIYLTNIQKSVLNNIQRIYCTQGIHISDKHIEVIVRQITSNVLIIDPGQTGLLCGEIIEYQWAQRAQTSQIFCNQIIYEPLLIGMTKTCLQTASFISAASFQETTRVLSRAAFQNQIDFLRGLKQNVILGNIIPAGTGF